MTAQTCQTCRWWAEHPLPPKYSVERDYWHKSGEGSCKRYPTSSAHIGDDWCGEHAPKAEA